MPKNLDVATLSAPLGQETRYDRRALLELIVENAQRFLSDAAGASSGALVSLVQSRGVIASLEAYLAYASRPFDSTEGDREAGRCGIEGAYTPNNDCYGAEDDVKAVMFEVLRLLFVDKGLTWIPSASHQVVSPLVSLPGVMDVASLYYYGQETLTAKLVDGMVRLGAMREGQYAGWMTDIAENMAQVAMRVIDATAESSDFMDSAQSALVGDAVRDVRDGVMYLRDACLTLCCALAASESLRHLIVSAGCLDRLLSALDDVHDGLMPKLYFYVGRMEEARVDSLGGEIVRQQCCELECAAGCAASWLLSGLLTVPIDEEEVGGSSSHGKTGGSIQRGEMLLQALCILKGREGMDCEAGPGLSNALAGRYGLAGRARHAIEDGRLFVDDAQKAYMLALLGVDEFADPKSDGDGGDGGDDVDTGIVSDTRGRETADLLRVKESLIRQVEEVLPGMYGAGFLAMCLDEYGDSPERVIDALLGGSVPKALEGVKQELDLPGYLETKEKVVEAFPALIKTGEHGGETKERKAGPKKKANAMTSRFLDTVETSYKDRLRNSIIASQWEELEYDDEYDDTFDDAVKEDPGAVSGQDGDAISGNDNGKAHGRGKESFKESFKDGGPVGRTKQSKIWVLDGRLYNYPKAGARAVSSQEEADAVLAEQELSKLEIHGLGPQGNKHVAVANMDAKTKPKGNPKNRASYKEKHKAAIGNHHRKDRAAKKQAKAGGP